MHLVSLPASCRNCASGSQRHPRILFSAPVMLRHLAAGGVRSTRGITLDISEGGLGALVQSSLQVGETVSLELQLEEFDLKAVAIVRHSSSQRAGFEFLGLTPEERERLASLVGSA